MKCQILFSGKNKKNILKCRLLQILPRVLSVKDSMIHSYEFQCTLIVHFVIQARIKKSNPLYRLKTHLK